MQRFPSSDILLSNPVLMKRFFTLLLVLFLSVSAGAQLNNYAVGDVAPDFTVTDIHGQTHQLSDYAGKWVVIDFYAYWCGPCLAISQQVNDFYTKYGCNGYDIVLISIEYEGTNQDVELIEQASGSPNPTPSASGQEGAGAAVHNLYGVAAFPTLVLIGPDGKFKSTQIPLYQSMIVAVIEGTIMNAGGTEALVEHSCSALGVDENMIAVSSVYPNPSDGKAALRMNQLNPGPVDITIYSISGTKLITSSQQVASGEAEISLDLSELAAGTYFVQLKSGEQSSEMMPVIRH